MAMIDGLITCGSTTPSEHDVNIKNQVTGAVTPLIVDLHFSHLIFIVFSRFASNLHVLFPCSMDHHFNYVLYFLGDYQRGLS
jgi:hypothetical protein